MAITLIGTILLDQIRSLHTEIDYLRRSAEDLKKENTLKKEVIDIQKASLKEAEQLQVFLEDELSTERSSTKFYHE